MKVMELKFSNFDKEIKNSKKPLIIDFWAPWCGPCQMMGPIFEEVSEEYKDKLKFAKVNVDEERLIGSFFDIQGIPCLSIVHKGKEIKRIVGVVSKEILKEKLNNILERIKNENI